MAQVAEETERFWTATALHRLEKTVPEAISIGAISLARDLQSKHF